MLKADFNAPDSRCCIYGSEEWHQICAISGSTLYFVHNSLWPFEMKKNFSDLSAGMRNTDGKSITQITAMEFVGPS